LGDFTEKTRENAPLQDLTRNVTCEKSWTIKVRALTARGGRISLAAEKYKRKLAAGPSASVEEYGRLMGEDEAGTLQTLKSHHQGMCSLVEKRQGRVVDTRGDNLLSEFASVVDALKCAVEIQKELKGRNGEPALFKACGGE
jgi:class 3 adenylate cyclase